MHEKQQSLMRQSTANRASARSTSGAKIAVEPSGSLRHVSKGRSRADVRSEYKGMHKQRTLTLTSDDMVRISDPIRSESSYGLTGNLRKPYSGRIPSSVSRLSGINRGSSRLVNRNSSVYGLIPTQRSLDTLPVNEPSNTSLGRGLTSSRTLTRSVSKLLDNSQAPRCVPNRSFFDRQVSVSELARFAKSSGQKLQTDQESQILITSLMVEENPASPVKIQPFVRTTRSLLFKNSRSLQTGTD